MDFQDKRLVLTGGFFLVLLSVIIPVYNVKQYLKRCIDSVILSLKGFEDTEIILIDDGSTDGSGDICNRYATQFGMIRAIHQPNRGLAAARNRGIKEAAGLFISFIDSDDYILPSLYKDAHKLIREYDADILCFKCFNLYESRSHRTLSLDMRKESIHVFNNIQALDVMFFDNFVDVITCNKIIARKLFEGVSYPDGKLYEDMFTTYKLLERAEVIVCTDRPYYIYCHRKESISMSSFNKNTMDLYKAVMEAYDFIVKKCGRTDNLTTGLLFWKTVVVNNIIRSDIDMEELVDGVRTEIRENKKKIFKNQLLGRTRKVEMLLLGHFPRIYRVVYRVYFKRFR